MDNPGGITTVLSKFVARTFDTLELATPCSTIEEFCVDSSVGAGLLVDSVVESFSLLAP